MSLAQARVVEARARRFTDSTHQSANEVTQALVESGRPSDVGRDPFLDLEASEPCMRHAFPRVEMFLE